MHHEYSSFMTKSQLLLFEDTLFFSHTFLILAFSFDTVYREYHHSPARPGDRRRVPDSHVVRPGRGPSTSVAVVAHRQHMVGPSAPPEDKSRIVVALFDYDPPNMSPNPETCHEELTFVAGDQIRVTNYKFLLNFQLLYKFLSISKTNFTFQILSDKDPDGFYWGECRGKRGYVPENMVTDIENAPKVNNFTIQLLTM